MIRHRYVYPHVYERAPNGALLILCVMPSVATTVPKYYWVYA